MLLDSQSLKRFRFNFCRAATNVAATSGGSVALLADTDDDACESPTARAITDRDMQQSSGHGIWDIMFLLA
jgi:hypothetical protein